MKTPQKGIFLFKGLSRTLFLGFLFFALVPLTVMGGLSYQNSISSLRTGTIDRLQDALELNHLYLEAFLHERLDDLVYQSVLPENVFFMQELTTLHINKRLPLEKLVILSDYVDLIQEHGSYIRSFLENSGYSDVFMIDTSGNVLFAFNGGKDRSINIFTGPDRDSQLARICRKTLQNGRPVFSDVASSGPSADDKAMFMARVMFDDKGEKVGIIAFQLNIDSINKILEDYVGLGETGRTYLVGDDTLMRSLYHSHEKGSPVLTNADSKLVRYWLSKEEELHGILANEEQDNVFYKFENAAVYHGPCGETVLGAARNFDFMERHGVHWLMVAEMHENEAFAAIVALKRLMTGTILTTFCLVLFFAFFITRQIVGPIRQLTNWAKELSTGNLTSLHIVTPANEIGDLHQAFTDMVDSSRLVEMQALLIANGESPKDIIPRSDKDSLSFALNQMLDSLRSIVNQAAIIAEGDYSQDFIPRSKHDNLSIAMETMTRKLRETDSQTRSRMSLNEKMRGEYSVDELSVNIVSFMSNSLQALVGAIFVMEEDLLHFTAGYAYTPDIGQRKFRLGEGLVGQAAREKRTFLFQDVPHDHAELSISSGMGEFPARSILVVPLRHGKKVVGVMEFGKNSFFSESEKAFAEKVAESIAISIHSAISRETMTLLLQETQEQKKILEKQTEALKASMYKSEFLANMSHELRSPLNSMLILARCLADNENGNLTGSQIEEAKVIYKSGQDLLHLINDILDLSKVEAGRVDVNWSEVQLSLLVKDMEIYYAHLAREKNIELKISIDPAVPESIMSDEQCVKQILKNLLSNAIKFTSHGSVALSILPVPAVSRFREGDRQAKKMIVFTVSDTGIGIPTDKQQAVFEAFKQADGSTSRKYGGTGLGLSISRSLTELIGGEMRLESVEGEGSIFSLYLPITPPQNAGKVSPRFPEIESGRRLGSPDGDVPDDTGFVQKNHQQDTLGPLEQGQGISIPGEKEKFFQGKTVLVVDDDMRNTFVLGSLLKKRDIKVELAADGIQALEKLAELAECDLVLMDIMMPEMDGFEAMRRIRAQDTFKDLPIIALTAKAMPEDRQLCLDAGASEYLSKPFKKETLFAMMHELMS